MKKIICLILTFILIICSVSCSCNEGEQSSETEKTETQIPTTDVTFSDSEIDMVTSGTSPYTIILPENPEYFEQFAADEFKNIFYKSTGIELPVTRDSGDLNLDGYYFSIGDTSLKRKAGTELTIKDKDFAYKIERKENTLIMYGDQVEGTVYAVYEFLDKQLGYRFFAADEIYVEAVVNEKLLDINFEYAPYMARHQVSSAQSSPEASLRYHCVNADLAAYWPHSHFYVLPPRDYQAAHPDWYDCKNTTGTAKALCLTVEGVWKEFAKKAVEILDDTGKKNIVVGQEDSWDRCVCENCTVANKKYGKASGTNLKFVINIIEEMKRIYAEQGRPDFEFEVVLMGYYQNADTPAVKNADGVWEIHDELNVTALGYADNFAAVMCPHTADGGEAYKSVKNEDMVNNIEGWKSITNNLEQYTYRGYFLFNELMYLNDWAYLGDWIKTMGEYGVRQGKWDTIRPSIFFEMRAYILGQLCYDVTQEPFELAKEFITHYYKDAAPYVQSFFDGINTFMNQKKAEFKAQNKDYGMYTLKSQSGYLFDAKNWPYATLKQWEKILADGVSAIENGNLSKKDKELVLSRLEAVSVFPRYWLLKFYKENYTTSDYQRLSEEVLNQAYMLGYAQTSVYLD